jgi:hypothetical protein
MRFVPNSRTAAPSAFAGTTSCPRAEVTVSVSSVDIVLAARCRSTTAESSTARRPSGDRRIGFNIQYLPTHVRQVVGRRKRHPGARRRPLRSFRGECRPSADCAGGSPGFDRGSRSADRILVSRSEPTLGVLGEGVALTMHDLTIRRIGVYAVGLRPRGTWAWTCRAVHDEQHRSHPHARRPGGNRRSRVHTEYAFDRWPRRCGRCCGRYGASRSTAWPSGTDSGP